MHHDTIATTITEPFVGHGRLKVVDTESAMAQFEWLGEWRRVSFDGDLTDDMQRLEGRFVKLTGVATFDAEERMVHLTAESVVGKPSAGKDGLSFGKSKPFDPNTTPRANFDFDVHEFLRPIYEERKRGRGKCVCLDK